MCDLACRACDEILAYLAAVRVSEGAAAISLCMFCGHANALYSEDGHQVLRELDPEMRQALLMDPAYQRIVFEKAMGHS